MRLDDAIPGFVAGGLPAIEVWHSDHDADGDRTLSQRSPRGSASACPAGRTFTPTHSHHAAGLGSVTLPADGFADLESRAGHGRLSPLT